MIAKQNVMVVDQKIKKLHIAATVKFAIKNVPSVDEPTLKKFMELVYATGNFGGMSEATIIEKIEQIIKYVPGSCKYSLYAVAELLDIRLDFRGDKSKALSIAR